MKGLLFSILFFFFFQISFSQIENSTLNLVKTYENEINKYKNELNIIDNVIFRFNINRFENLRTSFQLRLMLNSYGILKTKGEEITITKQLNTNYLLTERNKILKSHYEKIINYFEIYNQYSDIKKSLKHCKKTDSLYIIYIKSHQQINYKDYISNKQTLFNLELKSNNYSILLDSIKNDVGIDLNVKNINQINLKEIKKNIDSLKISNKNNLNKDTQKLKVDLLQSNINHVTAQKNQFIENIILAHNLRDDLIVNDRFSIGLSLKLPWLDSSNKNMLNKLQFEKKIEEFKSDILNENIDFELNNVFREFEINYENYENVLRHMNDQSWTETYNLIVNSGKISIFETIEFEKYNQNIQKELNDYAIKLLKLYLESLSIYGDVGPFKDIFKN